MDGCCDKSKSWYKTWKCVFIKQIIVIVGGYHIYHYCTRLSSSTSKCASRRIFVKNGSCFKMSPRNYNIDFFLICS